MWWIRHKETKQLINISNRFGYVRTAYKQFKRCGYNKLSNHQKRLRTYMEPHIKDSKRDNLSPEQRLRIKAKLEKIEAGYVDRVWAQGLREKAVDVRSGGCGGQCRQCGECKQCYVCTNCMQCGKYVRPYLNGKAIVTALSQGAWDELGLSENEVEIVNGHGKTLEDMVTCAVKPGYFALRHSTEKWYFSARNSGKIWYKRKTDVTRVWLQDETKWAEECDRAQADSFTQRHFVLVEALETGTVKEWPLYQDRIIPRKDANFRYA